MFDDIFLAISMLSRIKTPDIKRIDYCRSVVFFPLVGYMASAVIFLSCEVFSFFTGGVLPKALALGVYYLIFGFFHFDGLLDVIDGFMSPHKDSEKVIKIMKEPTIGAFALLFGFFFLLVEFTGIVGLEDSWFMFPVFGRISMILQIKFSRPYSDKGLGALFHPLGNKRFAVALLFLLPFIFHWKLLVAGFSSALASFLILKYAAKKKLGGFNGDVLGATAMLAEMFFVILLNTALFCHDFVI